MAEKSKREREGMKRGKTPVLKNAGAAQDRGRQVNANTRRASDTPGKSIDKRAGKARRKNSPG